MSYSTKEIAAHVRKQLKAAFKNCKFSVTMESFSMGSSITISLMEGNFRAFKTFEEQSDQAILRMKNGWQTTEQVKEAFDYHIKNGYEQVNYHCLEESTRYTDEAKAVLIAARSAALHYNWDDSDSMTDYFDVHFYLHLQIGKYDRAYKEVQA